MTQLKKKFPDYNGTNVYGLTGLFVALFITFAVSKKFLSMGSRKGERKIGPFGKDPSFFKKHKSVSR